MRFLGIFVFMCACQVVARPVSIQNQITEVTFEVQEARTPAARAKGLKYVMKLPEKEGMLFLFDKPSYPVFWMQDTLIPLDMIFFNQEGVILQIEKNCVPLSEKHIPAKFPVMGVLEIGGGLADKYSIQVGNRLSF